MSYAQTILDKLKAHLALPWPANVSGQERVLMVVYPPNEERRIRRFIDSGEFAAEIRTLQLGWSSIDLSAAFSQWLPVRVIEMCATSHAALDDSGIVTDHSGVVTSHSGQTRKSATIDRNHCSR